MGTKQQIEQLVEDIQKLLPGTRNGPAPKNILAMARALLAKAKKEDEADTAVLEAIDIEVTGISYNELAILMNQAAQSLYDPPIAIA
jgi:hypothetical protein